MRAWLIVLVGCSSKPEPAPEVAAKPLDAAIAIDAAPEPVRTLTTIKVPPSFAAYLVGPSTRRPVMFSVDGDGAIVTTRLDTGATIDTWRPTELAELSRSPYNLVVIVRTATARELRWYALDGKLARTVVLPGKPEGEVGSQGVTLAVAADGKAVISIYASAMSDPHTFVVGTGGAIREVPIPAASDAAWLDRDRAAMLARGTVYVVEATALLGHP
jgi:hypothetical protein